MEGEEVFHKGSDDFRDESSFRTQAVAMKDSICNLDVDVPYDRFWKPEKDQVPLIYNDAVNIRMQFEYVHFAITRQYNEATRSILPSFDTEGQSFEDYMRLYRTKEGSDFALVANDGSEFAVHRAVLRARSEYFSAMLNLKAMESKKQQCVLPDIDAKILEVFLLFMYGGQIKFPEELLQPILKVADKYQFSVLKNYCEASLIARLMVGNAAHYLILADKYAASNLREACLALIKDGYCTFLEIGGMQKLKKNGSKELVSAV